MPPVRLTMAQALVRFLASQYVERDGTEQRFLAGCWGIFGHGNVAGIGQALKERPDLLTYHQARSEQGMSTLRSASRGCATRRRCLDGGHGARPDAP